MLLFINGKQIKPAELPIISPAELGLNVFETMQSRSGKILHLNEHLDRLFESAKTSGIEVPTERERIEKELAEIAKENPNHSIRLAVSEKNIFTIVSVRSYPEKIYREGVDLKTSAVRRNLSNSVPPEAKSGDLVNGLLAFLDCTDSFDRIYLGPDGYVREAGVWNFFMVKEGALKTPPTAGILNGVVRRFVLKYALELGISAEESFLTRHDVFNADEAFLTNSTGIIVPVRSLDGRQIGTEIPGVITSRLMKRFIPSPSLEGEG